MHRSATSILSAIGMSLALLLAACGGAPAASPTEAELPTPEPATQQTTEEATESPDETDAAEPTDEASNGVEVIVGASSFGPGELTVAAGTEVTFNNTSSFPHTITHGSNGRAVDDPAFDRNIGEGSTVTITFDEPGTYEVTCKIHPVMNMTVVVEG